MKELNLEYQELRERKAAREKTIARLKRGQTELSQRLDELDKLKARVAKERKDVDKLEGLSLTAIFHTILSSKTEQLEIERQQFLRAHLKWEQCHTAVSRLKTDVARWQTELKESAGLEAELNEVLAKKEALLVGEGGAYAEQLGSLAEQIADNRALQRELGEAWAAGDEASESLDLVIKSLKTAEGWGVYDMVAGGMFATAIKHSHLGKAKTAMDDAVFELRLFEDELKDASFGGKVLSPEISGFNRFGDYLLDGLIFDWVVQSKIGKSLKSCIKAQTSVKSIMGRLDREISEVKARARELESDRRGLIELA